MSDTMKPRRTSLRRAAAATFAAFLSVCCVVEVAAQKRAATPKEQPGPRAARLPEEVLLRVVRAEDERRWEDADLGALFADKRAAVRVRAALAAGRIGDEAAVPRLSTLLRVDHAEGVRAMAAFALGEIESAAGADALLEALRASKTPEVRARAVEAVGKIAAALPEAEAARKQQLGEAILATLEAEHKLPRPNRAVTLLAVTAALRARPANAPKTLALFLSSADARVRADAANALTRLRAKEALPRLREMLTGDVDAVARANAARALGAAEDAAALDALVARSLADTDARVRVSAVRSLALLRDARAADPLLKRAGALYAASNMAVTDAGPPAPEQNELLEIATTLGRVLQNTNHERAVELLRRLRWGAAPEVEIALARVAPAQYVRDLEGVLRESGGTQSSWQKVSAFGQGLGEIAGLTSAQGGNSFVGLQADAQIALRGLVNSASTPALAMPDLLRALAAFRPADLAAQMRVKLGAEDVIVRAAAADLLGELPPDAETSRALVAALPVALRDELNDAALSILSALSKQNRPEATAAIRGALEVTDYLVRRRASDLLPAGGTATAARVVTVATRNREADYRRALARAGKTVRAVVSTDKGAFTIELLPDDAPLNVDNFVELARKGFFNGITFHRVVPNFVIQGGDPRGDGNGGPGYQIRCEINQVSYNRGAVGMALSGKDTGGSQWFVTHSPQPHLDGGYTVFGRVTEGLEVVDRIARGDRIRSVTIK
ncbi:MAG TPA: peptidylprolyl isomerase [Pyrinomonadaceae bacterium]|nr:peptidylprolyl isomerase [Pyrinomonadaceae bacterium]